MASEVCALVAFRVKLAITRAESVADDSNKDTSKDCTSCGHNTCTAMDPFSGLSSTDCNKTTPSSL